LAKNEIKTKINFNRERKLNDRPSPQFREFSISSEQTEAITGNACF